MPTEPSKPTPTQPPKTKPTPPETQTPAIGAINKPKSSGDITKDFIAAIKSLKTTISFDMSAMELSLDKINSTILNAYYNVSAEDSTLKYAYSVVPSYDSNKKIAVCKINYMPYKTGSININNLPTGAYTISSYQDLISVTDKIDVTKTSSIYIINPKLDYDTMQLILTSQCGYGYIVYSFNDDATKLIATPAMGLTMETCLQKISKINSDALQILNSIILTDMSNEDKINAVYNYVTSTVVYDQRYYSDRKNMSVDSYTAFGAFENKLAICGGYSNAFNILLKKIGIQCYNVSGKGNGEYHMWNVAMYNGSYLYFDCTYDRGSKFYRNFAKTQDYFQTFGHSWNTALTDALIK